MKLKEAQRRFETWYVMRMLSAHNHNMTRTAEALGIDRSSFYRTLKRLGVKRRMLISMPVEETEQYKRILEDA